jgi:lipase maturation factor 1
MFDPEDYTIIASFFPRLLGILYLFVFGGLIFQIKGLVGENGILPAKKYFELIHLRLGKKGYYPYPSIFWLNSSNPALFGGMAVGIILSIFLILGFVPWIILPLLYILHLSTITAGQDFLGFGWESLLLEITVQGFLLSLTVVPNLLVWISINFLLFRFHLQAGTIKLLTGDKTWRNLTALSYHYLTQPLPNTIAWYMHKLPLWFQKFSTAVCLSIEIVVPFGIFLGEEVRLWVFGALFGLQLLIWGTGNFSYLNYITAILCTILLGNSTLSSFFSTPPVTPSPLWLDALLTLFGGGLLILQIMQLWTQLHYNERIQTVLRKIYPLHLVTRHAIFASMTTKRYEVILEGSNDGKEWREYTFKYKPSNVAWRPRRVAPYQPRIDWQMWFLPLYGINHVWYQQLLYHLLKGTPEVAALLGKNPFPNKPPRYIRAHLYDYVYTTFKEKKETGCWWKREFVCPLTPPSELKSKQHNPRNGSSR